MRDTLEAKQYQRNLSRSMQTSLTLTELPRASPVGEVGCQTEDDQEEQYGAQIGQILTLNELIKEKDETIQKYRREGEEMFEAIEKLEKQSASFGQRHSVDRETVARLE